MQDCVGLLGKGPEPLHDGLTEEAATELDAGDRDDDRVLEHHLEHSDGWKEFSVVVRRGVCGVEVIVRGFPWSVLDHEEVQGRKHEQENRRYVERGRETNALDEHLADVKGEVDAERDQNAEDGSEHATFFHVEPGRVDLYDRDRSKALEVHVRHVQNRKDDCEALHQEVVVGAVVDDLPGAPGHTEVRQCRAHGADDDGEFATQSICEGAVQKKREAVDECSPEEEPCEDRVAHQGFACQVHHVAERVVRDLDVVAPHVQERVRQT